MYKGHKWELGQTPSNYFFILEYVAELETSADGGMPCGRVSLFDASGMSMSVRYVARVMVVVNGTKWCDCNIAQVLF